jgi:predicted nucleic acid-binding protein
LRYLLDACALIAFLAEERGKGYEEVKALFNRAGTGEISISMSIVNLIEVYYGFIQKYGTIEAADVIMSRVASLLLTVINTINGTVYREAARFKAVYSMSLADAFLCACAKDLSAVIVTKDDEIKAAEQADAGANALAVFWLAK